MARFEPLQLPLRKVLRPGRLQRSKHAIILDTLIGADIPTLQPRTDLLLDRTVRQFAQGTRRRHPFRTPGVLPAQRIDTETHAPFGFGCREDFQQFLTASTRLARQQLHQPGEVTLGNSSKQALRRHLVLGN